MLARGQLKALILATWRQLIPQHQLVYVPPVVQQLVYGLQIETLLVKFNRTVSVKQAMFWIQPDFAAFCEAVES